MYITSLSKVIKSLMGGKQNGWCGTLIFKQGWQSRILKLGQCWHKSDTVPLMDFSLDFSENFSPISLLCNPLILAW